MPEGDTVHKIAAYLDARLRGRRMAPGSRIAASPGMRETRLDACRVERVLARGKHLWIELDREVALRSHLGMHGTWHRYAPGEPWQRDTRRASIVLVTADTVLVCFDATEVELVRAHGIRARQLAARLGPDLAGEVVDLAAITARARGLLEPDTLVADLLLDQRVAAGIGNVYKSEVLFICRVHPRARVARLTSASLERLYDSAHALLRRNLGRGPRVTRARDDGRGRHWVYRRSGMPCFRCGRRVESARLGRDWRSTYWCPSCQPSGCGEGAVEGAVEGAGGGAGGR